MEATILNKKSIQVTFNVNDYVNLFSQFDSKDQTKILKKLKSNAINKEMNEIKKGIKNSNISMDVINQEIRNYRNGK